MTEGSFEGVEGITIFTREWQPAGESRGVTPAESHLERGAIYAGVPVERIDEAAGS